MAIPSAIIHNFMDKNIFPYKSWCIKICRNNIFFRLEEAHSSEQKLVSFQKLNILLLRTLYDTSSLFIMYICSPIVVALYSFSRFMSDLPPSWYGRYILSTSAFLASIQFIHSCFLVILSRSYISSSFQSMTP